MRHSSTRARKRKKRGANKSTLIIAAIIALVILLGAGCGFIGATIVICPMCSKRVRRRHHRRYLTSRVA